MWTDGLDCHWWSLKGRAAVFLLLLFGNDCKFGDSYWLMVVIVVIVVLGI